jgi:hypothetical protein
MKRRLIESVVADDTSGTSCAPAASRDSNPRHLTVTRDPHAPESVIE